MAPTKEQFQTGFVQWVIKRSRSFGFPFQRQFDTAEWMLRVCTLAKFSSSVIIKLNQFQVVARGDKDSLLALNLIFLHKKRRC